MKKQILVLMLICLFTLKIKAQQSDSYSSRTALIEKPILFGAYVAPGMTTTLGSRFTINAGFEVQKKIISRLNVFVNAGVIHFKSPEYKAGVLPDFIMGEGYEKNVTLIPVKAGLRYFLLSRFYVEGEAGIALDTQGGSSFVWSPGIGLVLPGGFDLAVKFDNAPNHVAARLTYHFGSGK
ncbi:hypothetical protein DBR11_09640 [Pedobacter sp. HMWF019]|uniref:hypothetical protein n=1 Tax=Pedobacter sp. HMWF019 TaxID=2056856 RepID=UPI000D37C07B|nr:hypothetical protein [Pedobacter sp. HMWF019]PTT00538.1 hypothetical protein DBR11_09640 [Pedobacter sp. HMWF019]